MREKVENFSKQKNIYIIINCRTASISDFEKKLEYALINRSKIRNNIYEKVQGGINQNSMIVYSGLEKNKGQNCKKILTEHESIPKETTMPVKPGCIYSGDADINLTRLELLFHDYLEQVGTIQIPHHGSINNFNKNVFLTGNYICPISFGKTNTYGHPSKNLINILKDNQNYPIEITEERKSMCSQKIEYAAT